MSILKVTRFYTQEDEPPSFVIYDEEEQQRVILDTRYDLFALIIGLFNLLTEEELQEFLNKQLRNILSKNRLDSLQLERDGIKIDVAPTKIKKKSIT